MSIHEITVKTIDGAEKSLADYSGRPLLIVNVASQCGLTPHYAGLQKLHEEFAPLGLAVLGFPCNQFGHQEPGTEGDIKSFCETSFGVTFDMFSKVDVKGEHQHPLFAALTTIPDDKGHKGDVRWNFEKFVVDGNGEVVSRFNPTVVPEDPQLRAAIEATLAENEVPAPKA